MDERGRRSLEVVERGYRRLLKPAAEVGNMFAERKESAPSVSGLRSGCQQVLEPVAQSDARQAPMAFMKFVLVPPR